MAEFDVVIDDSACEQLALSWQSEAIRRLNGILLANKVEDHQTRKKILDEFFFDLAVQLDGSSAGIEFNDAEYRPRLVFESPDSKLLVSDRYDLHDSTLWETDAQINEES